MNLQRLRAGLSAVSDFADEEAVRHTYFPEIEQLVAEHTGASRVYVFDHTIRNSDEATRVRRQITEPVAGVHGDFTEWSAPKRVRDLLPDEADELLKHRYAIVQVWRPINRDSRPG